MLKSTAIWVGVLMALLIVSFGDGCSRRKTGDSGLVVNIMLGRSFHSLLADSDYQEAIKLTCEAKEKINFPLGPKEIRLLQRSFPYKGTTLKSVKELVLRESYGMYELTLEDKSGIKLSNLILLKRGEEYCISLTESTQEQASASKF